MGGTRRRWAWAVVVASLAAGCTPLSVSHYQTGDVLPRGEDRVTAGFQIAKDGDVGTDRNRSAGHPVDVDHAAILVVDNLEVEYRRGVGARTELVGQAWFPGAKVGARMNLYDAKYVKVSAGAFAGVFAGAKIGSSTTGSFYDFPLTVSWHRDEWLAVLGGVTATRINVNRWVRPEFGGRYTRRAHLWQAAGFAGFSLRAGKTSRLRVYPGVTWYLEPGEYPISDFEAGAIYSYPWVGLSFDTGPKKKKKRPRPVPPMHEVEPEWEEEEEEMEEEEMEEESEPEPASATPTPTPTPDSGVPSPE